MSDVVSDFVKRNRDAGTPLMEVCRELTRMLRSTSDIRIMEASQKAAAKIEDILVSRNVKGRALEKSGEVAKAVRLYEKNVSDRFDGSHPYERLRLIYSSQKREQDVRRICQAFIDHGGHDSDLKQKYADIIARMTIAASSVERP